MKDQYRRKIETYYTDLYKSSENEIRGVGSSSMQKKNLRYQKISNVFKDDNEEISIHDVGFALGHFYDFIRREFSVKKITYSGSEVTNEFTKECIKKYPECSFINRCISKEGFDTDESYDYIIFSGTFYHQADIDEESYFNEIKKSLEKAFEHTNKAIAINFLTTNVDYKIKSLYYQEMSKILQFIHTKLSRFIKIDQDYPLYEYTIFIYKESYIKQKYQADHFKKYF